MFRRGCPPRCGSGARAIDARAAVCADVRVGLTLPSHALPTADRVAVAACCRLERLSPRVMPRYAYGVSALLGACGWG